MIKIKTKLFEKIVACTIFPNIGFLLSTIILIISLVKKQDVIVYQSVGISYVVCIALLILSIILCFIITQKSKDEMMIDTEKIVYKNKTYQINQIKSCDYYLCKWYCIPVAFIYKQEQGGLFYIKFITGETIEVRIFYSDYKKINKIMNVNIR